MNGALAGGLASGLAGGFTLADQYFRNQSALKRQDAMDEAALADRAAGRDLQQQSLDLQREQVTNAQANAEANQALAAGALGLNSTRANQAENQRQIENQWRGDDQSNQNAEAGLRRQALQHALTKEQDLYPLEKEAKTMQMDQARWEASRQKVPFIMESLKRGMVDPGTAKDFYETLKEATHGIAPESWANGDMLPVFKTVKGIIGGQIPMNSPEANQALGATFPNLLKRGIGEKVDRPDAKGTIVSKEPAGMFESPDHPGMLGFGVKVNVKGDDGQDYSYVAPVTVHGTSDPNDQALLVSREALENHYVGLLKFQDAMQGDPDLSKRLTDLALAVKQSPKDAAQTEKLKAEAGKIKSETGAGGTKDPVLKDVHHFIEKKFGGAGLDAAGFDPGAMDNARVLAGELRQQDPDATAEEIYGEVVKRLNRTVEEKKTTTGGKKSAAPAASGADYSRYWK
jgi:hypothetical protein